MKRKKSGNFHSVMFCFRNKLKTFTLKKSNHQRWKDEFTFLELQFYSDMNYVNDEYMRPFNSKLNIWGL